MKSPLAILKQRYIQLNQLLIDEKIDSFEQEIFKSQPIELFEFLLYCQKCFQDDDFFNNYFGIKLLGEITYLLSIQNLMVTNPKNFDEVGFRDKIFKGLAYATQKAFDYGYYKDAEKYALRVIEYPRIEKNAAIAFLSKLAIIANYYNEHEKELKYCEEMMKLDGEETNVILNYTYSLYRNKQYEKAKIYLEKCNDETENYFQKYNQLVLITLYGWQDYKKAFKYIEKIGELSKGGVNLNERNRYLYLHNLLIVCALSGSKELLGYILDFKKNAKEISNKHKSNNWDEILLISKLTNKGIFELSEGNFIKAREYFNEILNFSLDSLDDEMGSETMIQLAKFLQNICSIIDENQKLYAQPIEKLPVYIEELLSFIQRLETDELFKEYKYILTNYFNLLKSFALILLNNQPFSDLDKRKSILQKFHQKKHNYFRVYKQKFSFNQADR